MRESRRCLCHNVGLCLALLSTISAQEMSQELAIASSRAIRTPGKGFAGTLASLQGGFTALDTDSPGTKPRATGAAAAPVAAFSPGGICLSPGGWGSLQAALAGEPCWAELPGHLRAGQDIDPVVILDPRRAGRR